MNLLCKHERDKLLKKLKKVVRVHSKTLFLNRMYAVRMCG